MRRSSSCSIEREQPTAEARSGEGPDQVKRAGVPEQPYVGFMSLLRQGIALASLCLFSAGCTTPPPLNVVVILIDDMGWADAGVLGSSFYETPSIDALADQGARFTQFYTASSVCSPTRASLMTGKHPARLDLTNWIGGEQSGLLTQARYIRELPLDEVTIGVRDSARIIDLQSR